MSQPSCFEGEATTLSQSPFLSMTLSFVPFASFPTGVPVRGASRSVQLFHVTSSSAGSAGLPSAVGAACSAAASAGFPGGTKVTW